MPISIIGPTVGQTLRTFAVDGIPTEAVINFNRSEYRGDYTCPHDLAYQLLLKASSLISSPTALISCYQRRVDSICLIHRNYFYPASNFQLNLAAMIDSSLKEPYPEPKLANLLEAGKSIMEYHQEVDEALVLLLIRRDSVVAIPYNAFYGFYSFSA